MRVRVPSSRQRVLYNVTVSITGFEPVRLGSNPSRVTNIMSYGVIGNTSDFGSEDSRFEPWWDNRKYLKKYLQV